MSTKIKQVAAKFDDDFDYTFDLIVGRFMGTCEETESASNECACADDVRKRVAEDQGGIGGVLGEAMSSRSGILLASLRRASGHFLEAALPIGLDPRPPLPLFTFHERDIRAYRCHADRSKKRRVPPCGRGLRQAPMVRARTRAGGLDLLRMSFYRAGQHHRAEFVVMSSASPNSTFLLLLRPAAPIACMYCIATTKLDPARS